MKMIKKNVKIKSDTEMVDIETIPYASEKRENHIDDRETMLAQEGKVWMKLTKKYVRNQNLKLQLRLKNKLQRE